MARSRNVDIWGNFLDRPKRPRYEKCPPHGRLFKDVFRGKDVSLFAPGAGASLPLLSAKTTGRLCCFPASPT
jgi:hypothetical protein